MTQSGHSRTEADSPRVDENTHRTQSAISGHWAAQLPFRLELPAGGVLV